MLLGARRTLGGERLVDDLGAEAPPASARKMIQVYVSRLRKLMLEGMLETRPPGYRLSSPSEARDLDRFECRHGLSYTVISGERNRVRAEVLFFVPLDTDAEIHRVTLTNLDDRPRSLQLFSLVEFCLWNAWDDQTNFQRNLSTGEVEVDGGAIYHTTEYRERRNHFAVYAVNAEPAGFDTDRDRFFGILRSMSPHLTAAARDDIEATFSRTAPG